MDQVVYCGIDKLKQLCIPEHSLKVANIPDANVVGAFLGIATGTADTGEKITVRTLVNGVQEKWRSRGNILSLTCFTKLGVFPEDFPKI